jgi:hypothetical protein
MLYVKRCVPVPGKPTLRSQSSHATASLKIGFSQMHATSVLVLTLYADGTTSENLDGTPETAYGEAGRRTGLQKNIRVSKMLVQRGRDLLRGRAFVSIISSAASRSCVESSVLFSLLSRVVLAELLLETHNCITLSPPLPLISLVLA